MSDAEQIAPQVEETGWYALYTMPQAEKKIAARLARARIEHFLPLVPRRRQWSDRIKTILFPLFPGYIFIRMEFYKRRIDVLSILGAVRFVEVNALPARLPDDDIASLQVLVSKAADPTAHVEETFPPGKRVIVKTGPFKGMRGEVHKIGNQHRIIVRLEACNLTASTQIDPLDLEIEI